MKNSTLPLLFSLLFLANLSAQSITDKEIESGVTSLVNKLNTKKSIKKVVIDDFTDAEGGETKLTLNLTEEYSLGISNANKDFSVFDRGILNEKKTSTNNNSQTLANTGRIMKDAVQTAQNNAAINSKTAEKTKLVGDVVSTIGNLKLFSKSKDKPKGVDAIITGTITEYKGFYRLIIKVIDVNNNNEIIVTDKADFTKTESILEMGNEKVGKSKGSLLAGNNKTNIIQNFKKDNLKFDLLECNHTGQTFDCVFQITNEGLEDTNFHVYNSNSRAINAQSGFEYGIRTIRVADAVNSNEIQKTLVANASIQAIFSFDNKGSNVASLSKIEIHCWAEKIGYFNIEIRSVDVK